MSSSKIERGIFLSEGEKERMRLEFITSCFRVWREFKGDTDLAIKGFGVLMERKLEIEKKGIVIPSQALRVLSLITERMGLIRKGRKGDNRINL
ncbi:MAG: hypothetical protein KAI16_01440 [Candidatus Pacebacteria bacterium]|nr:hypothetical protein [Candidatus Paceibacterota bacterium]